MTRGLDREAEERAAALEAYEAMFPNIIGNPFIPHWPTPQQARFLGAHLLPRKKRAKRAFQALYGGAAGGGKSDALLMAAAQYAWKHPEFRAAMFRRTYADLAKSGALMERAIAWWVPLGVHWNGTEKKFTFPNGAKVEMAHMSKPQAHLEHQGAEYHATFWDELTQHPTPTQYEYVALSRVRRGSHPGEMAIPLRSLSASNPGGPGHIWVKNRFVGGVDQVTGAVIEPEHPYFPARIQDNPHLDRESYIEGLLDMHPTVRAQLLQGDWSARDPGDFFRVEWFGPMLDPVEDAWARSDKVSIRWWDLAASEKPEACRTAGVLMSRHRSGVRAIEHARAFRATPGRRDNLIIQQAEIDGYAVTVGIEIEPGSGGQAQFDALERQLKAKGYKVAGARPKAETSDAEARVVTRQPAALKGKEGRANPVASCLERGHRRRGECPDDGEAGWGLDQFAHHAAHADGLRLYAGPWTQPYLDEVESFPDADLLDLVDATSGAYAWLEAHRFGLRAPGTVGASRTAAQQQDVHPEDRSGAEEVDGRDLAGRWKP